VNEKIAEQIIRDLAASDAPRDYEYETHLLDI
jgi:hypothetical protein